jgi:hypothetical protein
MFTTRQRYALGTGTAMDDFVEDSGIYAPGDNPTEALRPFFEKVFDCFGLQR